MSNFDVNMPAVAGVMSLLRIDLKARPLTAEDKAMLVRHFADELGVPATVWSPADLVARSTNWTDDEMTEAEVAPHRERAAKAYELLPRLMQKADQDYSVVDWALALAESEEA